MTASPGSERAAETVRAYDASGRAWADGADPVFDRLAEAVVACWPGPLAGRRVLDAGAGTGAACRAVAAAGGIPVAVDAAWGMLREYGGPSVTADFARLPCRTGAFQGAVATFSLTHAPDAAAGFREVARAVAAGGPILASGFLGGRDHPSKAVVEAALAAAGWRRPAWFSSLRGAREHEVAVLEGAARSAGLAGVECLELDVDTGITEPEAMVAWRLAMAHSAPFVAALDPTRRAALVGRAVAALQGAPPVVLSIGVVRARAPGGA